MTRMDKLAREVAVTAKRLECARELLLDCRHEYNTSLALLRKAWDERMDRKNG
jgi:hypothetical protein